MKSQKSSRRPLVSVVIPVFNEEGNIEALHDQLQTVFKALSVRVEFLFVDDGSVDGTLEVITELARTDNRVRAVSFSRNFGHQAALSAGLDLASGDAVITMDGDLQHPPRIIPELLNKWNEGFDVVYTVRQETKGVSSLKTITARLFYRLINRIGNVDIPPNTADFRLLSRQVVDELNRLEERALFLRGLVRWVGFPQTSVAYVAEERASGKTKYSFRSMMKFALDGVVSFSSSPLHAALYFGFAVSVLSFLYGAYAIYVKLFTTESVPGWASVLTVVSFLGGIQLVTVGIIGLYLGKLFGEVKKRPRYIIRRAIGTPPLK